MGKAFQAGQTALQVTNLGRTLTSEEPTDEQKAVASVQGSKILADFTAEKAKKEGVQAIGKAAGTAAGGVIGGYTMYTEAGEAKESWEEGDYDEAILHGISSVSGGLQTAGAGMMLSGVGAPIGAVLYGIGTAGTVISNVGQLFEGLFGKDSPVKEKAPTKPKFDVSQYFDSIRKDKRYTY